MDLSFLLAKYSKNKGTKTELDRKVKTAPAPYSDFLIIDQDSSLLLTELISAIL